MIGDARLKLAEAAPASFDILVIDAFSSDAIPMHLLTKEAFAIYKRVLRPGGVLMIHISNRHLELRPVVRTGGESVGMAGVLASAAGEPLVRGYESTWTALSSDPATLARVRATEPEPVGQPAAWPPGPLDRRPCLDPAGGGQALVSEVVAETARLRLRTWDDARWDEFVALTNTPAVMRWLGGVFSPEQMAAARLRLDAYQRDLRLHLLGGRAVRGWRDARLLRAQASQRAGGRAPAWRDGNWLAAA